MIQIPIERRAEAIPEGYVKVIRCKDCKHYVADDSGDPLIKYCELTERVYVKDFYCKFGERKEETEC